MALVINGVTIPTTGDFVKVGNTNVTKVNVVKGGVTTTVWEKQQDISVTPGNSSGTSVTGSWSKSGIYSNNGDKAGTSYYVRVSNIDLTPYKKIRAVVSCGVTVSADNGAGFKIKITTGSLSSSETSFGLFHPWDPENSDSHGDKSQSYTLEWNVSNITGTHNVSVMFTIYHDLSRVGGNAWLDYSVSKIEFLT